MIKYFLFNKDNYFIGTELKSELERCPSNSTLVPVADENSTYKWNGFAWIEDSGVTPPVAEKPPPVPEVVSMRQFRLALLGENKLDLVNTAVNSLTGTEGDQIKIEWEYSTEVERSWPSVLMIANNLGFTTEEMDALFISASRL